MEYFAKYLDDFVRDATNTCDKLEMAIDKASDSKQNTKEEKTREEYEFIAALLGIVLECAGNFQSGMISGDRASVQDRFMLLLDSSDKPLYGADAWKVDHGWMEQEFDKDGRPVFEAPTKYNEFYEEMWTVFQDADKLVVSGKNK